MSNYADNPETGKHLSAPVLEGEVVKLEQEKNREIAKDDLGTLINFDKRVEESELLKHPDLQIEQNGTITT